MDRPVISRLNAVVPIVVALLLGVLAVVQYRWSARVAAADEQREREHLDTAASLFASEFNDAIAQVVEFTQEDAQRALKSGEKLPTPPKLVRELYYVDAPAHGPRTVKRLGADGYFVQSPPPEWMPNPSCAVGVLQQPPALVSPILAIQKFETTGLHAVRVFQAFGGNRCLVTRLDEDYLRTTLFPQLLQKSFGESSWKDYQFAVVQRQRPERPIYGEVFQPDVSKLFFAVPTIPLPRRTRSAAENLAPRKNTIFVERYQSFDIERRTAPNSALPDPVVLGKGVWELGIRHKGVSLPEAFEQTRRRNLFLSIAVEALLGAAIVFLVIGVRRMQRLAEQKMQFVAAVSHELRAPVSAISMLSRNQADGLVAGTEKVQQYGELMNQQSRRLNEMVEQTLQYAGIHSNLGRPAKTEIDLKRLIQEAVEGRREDFQRRGVEVEIDIGPDLPAVYGDAKLLRIALDNLLSNAEKYAGEGRWIRIGVRHIAAEKEVTISVEDRGPGISSEDQAEIFEPFSRGRAAIDAQIPGSGIGLSLVRSAAEAHRGSVTLASEPGHGSTFTLHLPV